MTKETKKISKLFFAWQDDKEEQWLSEMASQGWVMDKYQFPSYTFIKSEPRNFTYKLDYRPIKNQNIDEYKSIFKDAGWDHVAQFTGWHYFRTEQSNSVTPDIYSDNASRIQKYKSVLSSILMGFILLFLLSMNVFTQQSEFSIIGKSFYAGLLCLLGLGLFMIVRKIRSLKKDEKIPF